MLEIIENFNLYGDDPVFWAVGASFVGTIDQSNRFIADKIWEDGWGRVGNDGNKAILSNVKKGDYFLMKSSFTIGRNHATTCTRLKAIGRIKAKSASKYYLFLVDWYVDKKKLPKDFANISYRETIELLRNDELLDYAKTFIKTLS